MRTEIEAAQGDRQINIQKEKVEGATQKYMEALTTAVHETRNKMQQRPTRGITQTDSGGPDTDALAQTLAKVGDELRFIFITSTAKVESLDQKPADAELLSANGLEFAVHTSKASGEKCVRCWHLREDVGTDSEHPEVCGRCISNVHGTGEKRSIA